jgi:hypothetical protein
MLETDMPAGLSFVYSGDLSRPSEGTPGMHDSAVINRHNIVRLPPDRISTVLHEFPQVRFN